MEEAADAVNESVVIEQVIVETIQAQKEASIELQKEEGPERDSSITIPTLKESVVRPIFLNSNLKNEPITKSEQLI